MSLLICNNAVHHCRTCLTYLGSSGENKTLKMRYHLKTTDNLAVWIESFLSLRVLTANDNYPQFVCERCFYKLKEFHEFQQLALQTAEILSALLENPHTKLSENINILHTNHKDKIELQSGKNEIGVEEEFLSLKVKLEKLPIEPFETKTTNNADLNTLSLQLQCGTNSDVNSNENLETLTCNGNADINDLRNSKDSNQISKIIKKHKCNQCGYSFHHHSILNAHMRQIHNQAMPAQLLKSKPLKDTSVMSGKNIEKQENVLQCGICRKVFKCKTRFETHISSSHEKLRQFSCQFCHLRFTTRQNLTRHKRIHTGEKPFSCEVCDRRFNRLGSMKKHCKIHDSNITKEEYSSFEVGSKKMHTTEKPFSCEICDRRFRRLSSMKKHRKIHDNNLTKGECTSLEVVSTKTQKKTLQNKKRDTNLDEIVKTEIHIETTNEAEIKMEFECTETNATDVQKSININNVMSNFNIGEIANTHSLMEPQKMKNLERNVTADNNVSRNPIASNSDHLTKCKYKCDQCDQYFPHKLSVNAHKRHVHNQAKSKRLIKLKQPENTNEMLLKTTDESLYSYNVNGKGKHRCSICQREFSFNSRLKAHILLTHKGLRPFACQQCPLNFTTKCQLQTHERIHTGEKPFTCDICERSFTQLANLYEHRKYSHKYQFACDICDRRFATKCQLQTHENIHTGEKPFACDICDRSFTQLSNLYKHQKYTHKYQFACDICDRRFAIYQRMLEHRETHDKQS